MQENLKYLWLDMEMTGLDPQKCVILEVALIITDIRMNELARYEAVVHQPNDIIINMDEWCTKTHGESGLLDKIPNGKNLDTVEKEVLNIINAHFSSEERPVLSGNSIGQDRKFIDRYMKDLSSRLHYRMIDVSSFKEVFRDRYGMEYQKNNTHRALDDIVESIEELKFYLSPIDKSLSR